jgi:hypothetical protein
MMDKIKSVKVPQVGVSSGSALNTLNISAGFVGKDSYAAPKTSGIKIRGTGAATKGTKARGPMA